MQPPHHPSVSSLPSYATRPEFAPRPVSFVEAIRMIWRWWRGFRPTMRERQIEAAQIERLAAEMEAELPSTGGHKDKSHGRAG
jgi:hypothetical protein